MCGIYIIKNNINNLVYIGQSVNIQTRWYAHKQAAKNEKDVSHYVKIHQAMSKLGIDNFYYEVLEECSFDELSEREIYWIKQYNSYNNGYNMTPGGNLTQGEANGRAILTKSQVEDIRMAYGEKISFKEVYEKYKNVISKRGLQKVWHFETWKHILPEVYTEENRKWHSTLSKSRINEPINKLDNKRRACTEEEISLMREYRSQGLSYAKIGELVNRSSSVVRKYCLFQNAANPNGGYYVKNVETGLVFDSYTSAGKWACCDRHDISKNLNTSKSAGKVPSTNEEAHWISL